MESLPPEQPCRVDVSVIIVNYNVREFLEQALRSLERAMEGLSVEVFVVDNSSVDGSVEMLRRDFAWVKLIENRENVGFGRANNQALRQAKGTYVFLLNPDTLVSEDALHVLKAFMDSHPEAGAVGCKIVNPDGTFAWESRRAFPTPAVAFYRMSGLSRLFPRSRVFGRYNLTYLPIDEVAEIDALSGSCMFIRRAAFYFSRATAERLQAEGHNLCSAMEEQTVAEGDGAGFFDEQFFMYGEDIDLCYAIKQAGWKIYYTPETQIIHYKGESTRKGELQYVRHFYGAMLTFARKHFEHRFSRVFIWLLQAGIFLRGALTALANLGKRMLAPVADMVLAALAMWVAIRWRESRTGVQAPFALTWMLPLLYGAAVAGSLALLQEYRKRGWWRVVAGIGLSVALLAILLFMVRSLAYSRLALLYAAAATLALLGFWRWFFRRRTRAGLPHALVVGRPDSVERLARRIQHMVLPPFELVGYVPPVGTESTQTVLPSLGRAHQLRDIVRLQAIDEVIFDARSVENEFIIDAIQHLHDLPVACKILNEGQEYLIAKSDIQVLALPLVEAEEWLPGLHPGPGYYLGMRILALGSLLVYPLLWILRSGASSRYRFLAARLQEKIRHMGDVIMGRRAPVGFRPDAEVIPPEHWNLSPGVFYLDEIPQLVPVDNETAMKIYAYYAGHRSLKLDMAIIFRILQYWYRTAD